MDAAGTVGILAFLATVISFIVEQIKALVPSRYKDDKGLVFRRKGRSTIRIPSQAIWPLLSGLVGIGVFAALQFNLLGVGEWAGTILSGLGTGTAGGAAVFRSKSKLGSLFGGNEETDAQNTGPSAEPGESPKDEI